MATRIYSAKQKTQDNDDKSTFSKSSSPTINNSENYLREKKRRYLPVLAAHKKADEQPDNIKQQQLSRAVKSNSNFKKQQQQAAVLIRETASNKRRIMSSPAIILSNNNNKNQHQNGGAALRKNSAVVLLPTLSAEKNAMSSENSARPNEDGLVDDLSALAIKPTDDDKGENVAPPPVDTGSSLAQMPARDFLRDFFAIINRQPPDSDSVRMFIGERLSELIEKLQTSNSYDLKETLLTHLCEFMEHLSAQQVHKVLKFNNIYDALFDCMSVFMRRRSVYEQGLLATLDLTKLCAVQDKQFGNTVRKNDGIKLLCHATKHFLCSSTTTTKRFSVLTYIMRRLAVSPRNVTIMWQNGTIKSILHAIFAPPVALGAASASSSPKALKHNNSSPPSSTRQSLSFDGKTGNIVKDLLNILVTASKKCRALRSTIIEDIMRNLVRYLSMLRLPEDLKARATSVRLCCVVIRNLLSSKVGRKTFRAFRGIEAVCAICDATHSMTLVHLCGQILMAQKVPKRLPIASHRHPCRVPVIVAAGLLPLSDVTEIAKSAALIAANSADDEKNVYRIVAEAEGLTSSKDYDDAASSSEDDDEDIEPLRRQRYLTCKDDENETEEEEEEDIENADEIDEDEEEFEDEGDDDEENKSATLVSTTTQANEQAKNLTSTDLLPRASSTDEALQQKSEKKNPYNYGPNFDFTSIDVRSPQELTDTYKNYFSEGNAGISLEEYPFNMKFDTTVNSPLAKSSEKSEIDTLSSSSTQLPNLANSVFANCSFNYVLPFQQNRIVPTSSREIIPYAVTHPAHHVRHHNVPADDGDENRKSDPDVDESLHRGSLKGRKSILREDLLRLAEPTALINRVVYDLDSYFAEDGSVVATDFNFIGETDTVNTTTTTPILNFSGLFECGNLRKAIQIRDTEYDLIIEPDVNNDRRIQWFYFSVENMLADVPYRFNIINCEKETSQFNEGQQPILFSLRERQRGWHRTGSRVFYYRNLYRRNGRRNLPCRTTTFTITFPYDNDTCFIAYHFPYSYSMLLYDLNLWKEEASSTRSKNMCFQIQRLAQTLSGNTVPLLTITSSNNSKKKDYVILTSRVHPSESNSSFILRGCIDFLLSAHPAAGALRERYVFKIVPMLNPDGVINGMTRGTMSTVDLNRTWVRPNKTLQPETYHTKGLLKYMCELLGIVPFLFLDLHGHSRMKNAFLYGCDVNKDWYRNMYAALNEDDGKNVQPPSPGVGDADDVKSFASAMADICPAFSLNSSSFKVTLIKEPSARVVVWRQLQCRRSFTLESTFCGFDDNNSGKLNRKQINQRDLHTIGRDLMRALFKITKWPEDESNLSLP